VDGSNYYFQSRAEFERGLRADAFVEHAEYRGNLYGTPRAALEEHLRRGDICLLEIDVQGAMQLMPRFPDGVFIFVLPPSEDVLRQRLASRARERGEEIEGRLAVAKKEMEYRSRYGYSVVNDDLSNAVEEVWRIISDSVQRKKE
jgi:guanylate kinase